MSSESQQDGREPLNPRITKDSAKTLVRHMKALQEGTPIHHGTTQYELLWSIAILLERLLMPPRWETMIVDLRDTQAIDEEIARINKYGASRWELVAVDRGIGYFKRRIPELPGEA